ELFAVEDKADRNDQWLPSGIGGREVGDAGGSHQAQGACGQFNSSQSFQTSTLSPPASFPSPFFRVLTLPESSVRIFPPLSAPFLIVPAHPDNELKFPGHAGLDRCRKATSQNRKYL